MKLYAAIDLHSNNSVLVILDEMDRTVLQRRLPNNLEQICQALCAHREAIEGIAVESTYNWYWLVDGLMEAGYRVHLVNTAAVKQYEGLKHKEDVDDARWLAHLLRLGILPVGYICPKEARGVRDLMRKRNQLVGQRSRQMLSIENVLSTELRHVRAHERQRDQALAGNGRRSTGPGRKQPFGREKQPGGDALPE